MGILSIFKRKPEWEYGTFRDGKRARRNTKTGAVQFVMWMAGEQGHSEDYWINSDSSWWSTFVPVSPSTAQKEET